MGTNKKECINKAVEAFKMQKVIKLDQLMDLLKSSRRTTQQRLKEWGTYTSYNQNGRYYVLPDIPEFNQYGIWKFKNIFFSKHGNLKNVFVYIVDQSVSGLNAFEMSEIMGLPAHTFLSHFKNDPNIKREKHKGVYIYFSKKKESFEKQKLEREKQFFTMAKLDLPSDGDAIAILVELIKHPQDNIEQLHHRALRKGIKSPVEKIRNLLIYHGIQKKTPDIQ